MVSIPRARFSLLQQNNLISVADCIPFQYGGAEEAFLDLIGDHPLFPDHIHIWEFEIPESNRALSSGTDGIYIPDESSYRKTLRDVRRNIMAGYLNTTPSEIAIRYDETGKPVLENNAPTIFFSTSYTKGTWILGLSSGYTLGIDIEQVTNNDRFLSLAERFFYPEEWDALSSLPGDEQIEAFFRVWTLKEAYLKATGTGFSGWNRLPDMSNIIMNRSATSTVFSLMHSPYHAQVQSSDENCRALVFKKMT